MVMVVYGVILFVLGCNVATVYAATVEAVGGSTPTIDGTISAGEWTDASTITLTLPDGTCTVYVKQNFTHLNIAFHVPDDTYDTSDLCSVFFDTAHDLGDGGYRRLYRHRDAPSDF